MTRSYGGCFSVASLFSGLPGRGSVRGVPAPLLPLGLIPVWHSNCSMHPAGLGRPCHRARIAPPRCRALGASSRRVAVPERRRIRAGGRNLEHALEQTIPVDGRDIRDGGRSGAGWATPRVRWMARSCAALRSPGHRWSAMVPVRGVISVFRGHEVHWDRRMSHIIVTWQAAGAPAPL